MTQPHWQDESVTVYAGDCLDILAQLPENSIDACICDPPYNLTAGKKGGSGPASASTATPQGRSRITTGFMGTSWDATGIAFDPETWRQVMRVLKPGAHLAAFGGTRTFHRLACAIEDAGFEIRDSIAWLTAQGMPKSLDVSKAIDKATGTQREVIGPHPCPAKNRPGGASLMMSVRGMPESVDLTRPVSDAAKKWEGWGSGLRPSFEPIILARKPFRGTIVDNVLKYGTGAINIDACRIESTDSQLAEKYASVQNAGARENTVYGKDNRDRAGSAPHVAGRWPPNVILDDACAAELDKQSGNRKGFSGGDGTAGHGGARKKGTRPTGVTESIQVNAGYRSQYVGGETRDQSLTTTAYNDDGGASRFFPVFNGRDGESSAEQSYADGGATNFAMKPGTRRETPETPSEFFPTFRYEAKAPSSERPSVDGVQHCTVKPLNLIRWLARLVTPSKSLHLVCSCCGKDLFGVRREVSAKEHQPDGMQHQVSSAAAAQTSATAAQPDQLSALRRPNQGFGSCASCGGDLIQVELPGLILDLFAGSGTTGEAAIKEHKRAILVEKEAAYLPLIVSRLSKPMEIGFDFGD